MLFVRVQTACLTSKSRMGHLGEGARDGAGRRRDMHGGGGEGEERGSGLHHGLHQGTEEERALLYCYKIIFFPFLCQLDTVWSV